MEKAISKIAGISRLSVSIFIIVLCLYGTVFAERFAPKDAVPYGISDIGGCKIVSLYKDSTIPFKIRNVCEGLAVQKLDVGNSWHDYYSSIEWSIGSALQISLRSFSKSLKIMPVSLTKGREIYLVLSHDPLANAGLLHNNDYIVIWLNDGLIDQIENAASALEMPSTSQTTAGVNFVDWLELMRTPREKDGNLIINAGPDKDIHIGNLYFTTTWFWTTRIRASVLYQFIIGHELAHIYRNDIFGPPSLAKEVSCDDLSFNAFFINNDEKLAISTILPFMISMWYYESYWENEIRDSGRIIIKDLTPDLFARNWNDRGKHLLKNWEDVYGSMSDSEKAKKAFSSVLFGLRPPLHSKALNERAVKAITHRFVDVNYHQQPGDSDVDYILQIRNNDPVNTVKVTLEVQSRYFNRTEPSDISPRVPKDQKGRYYLVLSSNIHTITLPPKEAKSFKDTLPWFGNKLVYPGIAARVIAADYE